MLCINPFQFVRRALILVFILAALLPTVVIAENNTSEQLYRELLSAADQGGKSLFARLNEQSRHLDWNRAEQAQFTGNLRVIKSVEKVDDEAGNTIYLLRKLTGELFILSIPADPSERTKIADSPYAGLDDVSGSKMIFNVSNLHAFADTDRYSLKFYLTIFSLTMLGMIFGVVFSKLFRMDNYQTRAISLETGLRKSALAMTIALLIQDSMGDYYNAMFGTSGLFGLVMYVAGVISIFLYRPLLPIDT
jgi:hypothetical protein